MAATGAGDVFRGGVLEGSISGSSLEVDRRPYHKNCGCALHGSRGSKCLNHKTTHITFPIRRSWSEGSLALYAAASSSSLDPSPSTSPAVDFSKLPPLPHHLDRHHHDNRRLYLCSGEDDDDDLFPTKL